MKDAVVNACNTFCHECTTYLLRMNASLSHHLLVDVLYNCMCSVKCAWNCKSGGVVHNKSPAFFLQEWSIEISNTHHYCMRLSSSWLWQQRDQNLLQKNASLSHHLLVDVLKYSIKIISALNTQQYIHVLMYETSILECLNKHA